MKFFSSSIGLKSIMAFTGTVLFGFIVGHLVGNLGVFGGQKAFNDYAAFLHSIPKLLWIARIGIIVSFVLHLYTSIRLSIDNRTARPIQYQTKTHVKASLASRTMLLGGLVLLSFILYHLAHFTLDISNPEFAYLTDSEGRRDVYTMVIQGFQNGYVVSFYLLAQFCLMMHLSHGFSSAARTFGAKQKTFLFMKRLGKIVAGSIFILYSSIPLAVFFGAL